MTLSLLSRAMVVEAFDFAVGAGARCRSRAQRR
jgi:hypothetical protein